ncbi:MAG: Asp/Glu racemase [Sedimentitalea sp.]
MRFDYQFSDTTAPRLGLIVLQTDERIETDFRALLPADCELFVTRVPSAPDVSPETLAQMKHHLPDAARLLPNARRFGAVGYGCTSGTAQIGQAQIGDLVRQGCDTQAVSDPLSALVAACGALGLRRLAFLSPYVADVSDRLRAALGEHAIQTPVFGSFEEASEAQVARISPVSVQKAARDLAARGGVDGVFLSCTNLNTLSVIEPLEAETGVAVLSSNQVLAWHLAHLAGIAAPPLGRLGQVAP